jgi:GrpB-like predicted nucleotidyltransferase (UPF0157 family)
VSDAPQSGYRAGEQIVLVPHDAEWSDAFEREADLIRRALPGASIELHHIGSTAIPGIVAKPVIDMIGVVSTVEVLDVNADRLVAIGYEAMGEFGIVGRRYFRKDSRDGARTHQLHAFGTGSPDIQRHIDFRDYLRAFPDVAVAYEELKLALARRSGPDIERYADAKTEFVRDIERRAAACRLERAGRSAGDLDAG